MQITPGMKVSDVCMFCFEHTNDQPCPERDAWEQEQFKTCKHCHAVVVFEPGIGWVDTLTGDEGGTYDICPVGDRDFPELMVEHEVA